MFAAMINQIGIETLALAICIALVAGLVKGAVGFAMPMIMISGIGSIASAELAIAALILPTVGTNLVQAFRGGFGGTLKAGRQFGLFIVVFAIVLVVAAQFVTILAPSTLFAVLGGGVVFFGSLQLFGWQLSISPQFTVVASIGFAIVSGIFGGLSGVWGPAMIMYLLALNVSKTEMIRVQGLVYLLGSLLLLAAHLHSGVLNSVSLLLSLILVVPAFLGQFVGLNLHDGLDQQRFRKLTLIVLVIAGLNLLRRAYFVS